MDTPPLLPLFLASAANAAIPGPVLLLVIARATQNGLQGGAAAALGATLAVGLLLAAVVGAMLGVLRLGEPAFVAMKLAGVAVLAVLGVRMLRAAATAKSDDVGRTGLSGLVAGLAIGATSPFNLIFFMALLPQFVEPASMSAQHLAVACSLVLFGSALPVTIAATLAARQARVLPSGAVWVVRAGGAVLLSFACATALSLP